MRKIKDVKMGETLGTSTGFYGVSASILIARKQTLDNKYWYIVLALNPESGIYSIWRMKTDDDRGNGHYTSDFMEAVGYFLSHFNMSTRRKRK